MQPMKLLKKFKQIVKLQNNLKISKVSIALFSKI